MEGYMIDEIPGRSRIRTASSTTISYLAKNITGLRNLYRMVTLSHLKFYRETALDSQTHSGRIP